MWTVIRAGANKEYWFTTDAVVWATLARRLQKNGFDDSDELCDTIELCLAKKLSADKATGIYDSVQGNRDAFVDALRSL